MPYNGFQHKANGVNSYPSNASGSGFSVEEGKRIRETLSRNLGPEFVSKRDGPGGYKLHYLEGWKIVNLANEVFGFDGWNMDVRDYTVDYCDVCEKTKKVDLGLSAIIRITLKDGTFREDIGYGHAENSRHKHQAYEKAKKEATTDGLKRALRLFGNVLGNCLYDKDFLKVVTRMKKPADDINYQEHMLFRAPEFRKHEPIDQVPAIKPGLQVNPPEISRVESTAASSKAENFITEEDYLFSDGLDDFDIDLVDGLPYIAEGKENYNYSEEREGSKRMQQITEPRPEPNQDEKEAVAFVSARVAQAVQENSPLPPNSQFDPTFQSPSIRRTLNHNKSIPIKRTQDGIVENVKLTSNLSENSISHTSIGSPVISGNMRPMGAPLQGLGSPRPNLMPSRLRKGPTDLGPSAVNISPSPQIVNVKMEPSSKPNQIPDSKRQKAE